MGLGLAATLGGLAVGELVAGLFREAASPVVPVGQIVIDHVPASVRTWAIDTFGTADKAVLIVGSLLVLFGIGSVVGLLVQAGRHAAACALAGLTGVIGVWAVAERPAATFVKMLPAISGTLVTIGLLWWWARARPRADTAQGRREFLVQASSVGLVALMLGSLGRFLRRRFAIDAERTEVVLPPADAARGEPSGSTPPPAHPPTSDVPVEVLPADAAPDDLPGAVAGPTEFGIDDVTPFIVPSRDFYRIDTALVVPQVRRAEWQLRIHGMVDRELELTFDDLLARPQVQRQVTLSCVSNSVGGPLVGNALWQGVLLAPLLEECGLQPEATQVVSRSIDGWTCGSPTAAIMDGRDALVAIGMNGEALPAEHGYPVRLVVPGLYGYVSATKWVTEIELTRWEDFDAYWVPRGWSKEGPVKTMARIDRSADGLIAGMAWAVHRGVSRVEVSIDEGEWRECELAGVPSDDTWRQWRYEWADATPGDHTVRARAYDGADAVQPEGPKREAPDGAEGYHRVGFTIPG